MTESAGDVPGVEPSPAPLKATSWWQRMLEANGISTIAIIGAAIWVGGRFEQLDGKIQAVKERIEGHQEWHKTGVGSKPSPSGPEGEKQIPVSKDPPEIQPAPSSETPPPPPVRTLPSTVGTVQPPVCVSASTKARFPCEQASVCRPNSAYAASYLEDLKQRVGATSILVCDPR